MLCGDRVPFRDIEAKGMKTLSGVLLVGLMLAAPAVLHAAGGCVDSPECPTAVLGVVGAAGAALYVRWRSR